MLLFGSIMLACGFGLGWYFHEARTIGETLRRHESWQRHLAHMERLNAGRPPHAPRLPRA